MINIVSHFKNFSVINSSLASINHSLHETRLCILLLLNGIFVIQIFVLSIYSPLVFKPIYSKHYCEEMFGLIELGS